MRVIIVANGEYEESSDIKEVFRQADLIIAADGGANHLSRYNRIADVLLGDLDSITADLLLEYEKNDVEIIRYSTRKDVTDLELALNCAMKKGTQQIDLFGALGKRWDMSLANILLVASSQYKKIEISLFDSTSSMRILNAGKKNVLHGYSGQTVSLMPLGGDVVGVTLRGFEYPLTQHTIDSGSSIGVSNCMLKTEAIEQHTEGVLLCIQQNQKV